MIMELKKIEISVPKESYELAKGIQAVVEAVVVAVKDGFQPGQDIPAIVVAAVSALPAAVDGIDKLSDEAKDPVAFAKAFALVGFDIAAIFKKAPAAPVAPVA
jgi:hypothetical protein